MSKNITSNRYHKIHEDAIVVDSHNDILMQIMEKGVDINEPLEGKTHSDLRRWKQGGVNVQVLAVWCDGNKKNPFDYAVRQIDILDEIVKSYSDKIDLIANSDELVKVVKEDRIAAIIAIEGGHMIENDLSKLNYFFDRGVRYLTLTWNNSIDWASSAFDEAFNKNLGEKGLSEFGKQVVQRMNQLGMMVDISHVGEQTFWDVIKCSSKAIIASHSCVYSLCPTQRNLKDDQIKAIAKSGGVIQINFFSEFLDSSFVKKKADFLLKYKVEKDSLVKNGMIYYMADDFLFEKYKSEVQALRAPFSLLIDHIEYIINLVGINHVGLGSVYDGMNSPPLSLDDVSTYPLITKALVEKNYSENDIKKILGGNFLRVLRENEVGS